MNQEIPSRDRAPLRLCDRRSFLKTLSCGAAVVSLAPSSFSAVRSARFLSPRSAPEAQGVSSEKILSFLDAVTSSKHEFHSFMMLRRGNVIAEGWWSPYRPSAPHMLYSLSKSFTSTAVGFAVAEGRLKVTDPVISFFPSELPDNVSDNLAKLKVKDLLSMSVGHATDSTPSLWGEQNWVRKFLSLPVKFEPGTAFLYNSGATYMCSAIVQKVARQRLVDYLEPRLFRPLGIQGSTWEQCPLGIDTGGWGLKLATESIAKFGQLYLQKGRWNGTQLLPASWIDEATSFKIQQPAADLEKARKTSDWHQGYCYQFWRCRHNAYRGDGAFGQYCVVLPEQDAVIAITSESPNMQNQLDLIYEHLLPACQEAPLPKNRKSQSALKERLASLRLAPAKGSPGSPLLSRLSGKPVTVETNDLGIRSLLLRFEKNGCVFSAQDPKGEHQVNCGLEQWLDGDTTMPGTPPKLTQGPLGPRSKIAASGTWKNENTFEMTWRFYETPHHDTVTCRFEGGKVAVEFLNSLTKMNPSRKETRPVLRGLLPL